MKIDWAQTGAHLEQMHERGSSVILNWGEDTDCWECSWITSGKRYTGVSTNPHEAVRLTLLKFMEASETMTTQAGIEMRLGLLKVELAHVAEQEEFLCERLDRLRGDMSTPGHELVAVLRELQSLDLKHARLEERIEFYEATLAGFSLLLREG